MTDRDCPPGTNGSELEQWYQSQNNFDVKPLSMLVSLLRQFFAQEGQRLELRNALVLFYSFDQWYRSPAMMLHRARLHDVTTIDQAPQKPNVMTRVGSGLTSVTGAIVSSLTSLVSLTPSSTLIANLLFRDQPYKAYMQRVKYASSQLICNTHDVVDGLHTIDEAMSVHWCLMLPKNQDLSTSVCHEPIKNRCIGRPLVVCFPGHGDCMERILFGVMSKACKYPVLGLNYPGIGLSGSSLSSQTKQSNLVETQAELLVTCKVAIDAVIDRYGFDRNRVLFYGYSLGGAIATLLAKKYDDHGSSVYLFNDRSFSSLRDQVTDAATISSFSVASRLGRSVGDMVVNGGWELNAAEAYDLLDRERTMHAWVAVNADHPTGDNVIQHKNSLAANVSSGKLGYDFVPRDARAKKAPHQANPDDLISTTNGASLTEVIADFIETSIGDSAMVRSELDWDEAQVVQHSLTVSSGRKLSSYSYLEQLIECINILLQESVTVPAPFHQLIATIRDCQSQLGNALHASIQNSCLECDNRTLEQLAEQTKLLSDSVAPSDSYQDMFDNSV